MTEAEEKQRRITAIDRMFDEAQSWGSWMVSAANEREELVNQLKAEGITVKHRHQARTASGGRVS